MLVEKDGGISIDLKVIPKSSRDELLRKGDEFRLKLTAPPVDGKANSAAVSFLSKKFKISKSSVRILRGETSRNKTLFLEGLSETDFLSQIK